MDSSFRKKLPPDCLRWIMGSLRTSSLTSCMGNEWVWIRNDHRVVLNDKSTHGRDCICRLFDRIWSVLILLSWLLKIWFDKAFAENFSPKNYSAGVAQW